jgi:hypothetical protein
MTKGMQALSLLLLSANALLAQSPAQKAANYTISGYITDAKTGETLIGADVYVPLTKQGISTNNYGYYSITLPAADSVYLTISYIGYQSKLFSVKLDKDIVQNFKLGEGEVLKTVEISATKNSERIDERTQMSVREIPIGQIKQIPALLGEVDVLKALQLLPGVSGGGEGGSGLYVRGGSPDQNLILLDGVPVYNASHLFGFFSVFNSDAIKNVKLTTGGFPARYGGRLSSVLEINMKEGDMNEWHGEGAVGIIASRLTVEGPIKKGTTSVMVSGRRTYVDVLAAPIIAVQSEGKVAGGYFFYDLNAKVNHKFSDKDRLYFSAYTGQDKLYILSNTTYNGRTDKLETGLNWGNLTSALRWNHVVNSKLFSNTTVTYSNYEFNIPIEQSSTVAGKTSGFAARYFSGITDWSGKVDFDYNPHPDHYIKFGGGLILHSFRPGAINLKVTNNNTAQDTTVGAQVTNASELALYAEDDYQITKQFKANVGIHISGFGVNNLFYPSVQPRVSLNYALPNATAIKASFATMTQYIHLLTNEGIGLPTDLWVPSTDRIKPENSWQAAIGAARSIGANKDYEVTAEVYYKRMENVISYQEGASFINNANWQDIVTQGVGTSYGLELMVQKKTGRTTGWIGYTLAKTDRQFETINFGKPYPYKYDRRHDVEVVVSHQFTKRFSLSATWVYGTGNAISLPLAQFNTLQENTLNNYYSGYSNASYYGEKNSYRLPAYHRLDISMEFHKKYKKWERTWSFGAYNAYNSLNTFFVYRGSNENTGKPEYKQVTLFPIIPFLNYSFKF